MVALRTTRPTFARKRARTRALVSKRIPLAAATEAITSRALALAVSALPLFLPLGQLLQNRGQLAGRRSL